MNFNINKSRHKVFKDPVLFEKCSIFISTIGLALLFTACSSNHCYEQMLTDFRYSSSPPRYNAGCDVEEDYCFSDPFERSDLVNAVLSVNPSLEAARQAWRAMLARYPQVSSYDDPMASYAFAPGTITSKTVSYGQEIDLKQKIPFPGKLRLKGQIALAEAGSAEEDYEWAKIQLATTASTLFDNYYVVDRAIEINKKYIELLKEFKESAEAQYASSQVTAQVPLQAEVELARLEYEQITLKTDREVIIAKINALLHRDPSSPLPPPPKVLSPIDTNVIREQLQQEAFQNRPDLRAIRAQMGAAASALDLSYLDYFPDFELMYSYNTMWPVPSMFSTYGVGVNVPIQLGKRKGAVDEAKANMNSLYNRHLQLADQISVDVSTTIERISQAHRYIEILQDKIIPTAEDQLEVAMAGFETGKDTFLVLIESEKTLRTLELELLTATAELYSQLAMLDQAVGYILHFSQGEQCHE
ncbi:MAG: TolC family protein [Parachlamydiaceae bacterium]|nr:TolC family protein [Parachlamydiaceae bacterium]